MGRFEELAEQCEAATNGSFIVEREVAILLGRQTVPAFTSSLDYAVTLVPNGWAWMAGCAPDEGFFATLSLTDEAIAAGASDKDMIDTIAATPALALCAAALRARAAMETPDDD